MHAIGIALLGAAASSLCALDCDAFNVPLGAANLNLPSKRLNSAAATLLAGVIKGNTTIISLKCVQSRISHMVDQCLCLIHRLLPWQYWPRTALALAFASRRPGVFAFVSAPLIISFAPQTWQYRLEHAHGRGRQGGGGCAQGHADHQPQVSLCH